MNFLGTPVNDYRDLPSLCSILLLRGWSWLIFFGDDFEGSNFPNNCKFIIKKKRVRKGLRGQGDSTFLPVVNYWGDCRGRRGEKEKKIKAVPNDDLELFCQGRQVANSFTKLLYVKQVFCCKWKCGDLFKAPRELWMIGIKGISCDDEA